MFRYIAVAIAIKLVVVLALMASVYVFPDYDHESIPDLSTPTTIAAVAGAMFWFTKAVARPMRKGEILSFAGGVTVGEIVISIGIFVLMIIEAGQSISVAGLHAAISDGQVPSDTTGLTAVLIFGLIFGALVTFVIAAFFAWIMTKNLVPVSDEFD